ncbi:MAG: CZB domain-containing protein [Anaeromyxobacter sp.]|nr:CZB domain-containing protein [Anaeromyxobacter sp.]MBL0277517.1 CZB domain-containing protein [Anaeromyxobacter sp.]
MERLVLVQHLRAALAAHELWRSHLVSAVLTGKATMTVPEARSEDRCDFGRWLLRLGRLPEVPQVAQVAALHARFHEEAADVLDLALAGRRADATRAIGPGSRFDQASQELTAALGAWAEQV